MKVHVQTYLLSAKFLGSERAQAAIFSWRCDVKIRLWHASHDEMDKAFCANFVLQAMDAQSLGTRLTSSPLTGEQVW